MHQCNLVLITAILIGALGGAGQEQDFSGRLPRIPPLDPSAAIATFSIDSDLEIQLLASEPLVADPVAIDVDEFGRTYVAEMRGYSLDGEKRLGRIRQLRDTNQDGFSDDSTVYVDGLRWPTGLVCMFGGVLVADAPDLIFVKDTDGDGRADVREAVFTGFGTENIQQLVNSLHWGVDLKIYGSSGGNGGVVNGQALRPELFSASELPRAAQRVAQQRAPGPAIELRLRDFAIDPSGWSLLPISGGGQFGMTQDGKGNRFVCSNSDHCQQIILEDRYLARNAFLRPQTSRLSIAAEGPAAEIFRTSRVEPWRTLRTELRMRGQAPGPIEAGGMASGYFSGATGITHYDGDALPEAYRENLFVGDVGSNIVHRKQIVDEGVIKSARRVEQNREFVSSTDNWFRPVSFYTGPDGALWILDMYREVVEHPASLPDSIKRHLDLASGNDRGRLYRVVPTGFQYHERDWPGNCDNVKLVEMLKHPNGWHRRTAARILCERSPREIAAKLGELAVSAAPVQSRILALYLLAKRGELPVTRMIELLRDPQPYIRMHALRIADTNGTDARVRKQVIDLADDPDERVRFQAALSLGVFDGDDVDQAIARLGFREAHSAVMRDALSSSSNGRQVKLLRRLQALQSGSFTRSLGAEAFSIELVRQLGLEADRLQLTELAVLLGEIWRASPMQVGQWLVELKAGRPTALVILDEALATQGESIEDLIRESVANAILTARNIEAPTILRVDAVRVLTLSHADQFISVAVDLLGLDQPLEVRRAVIAAASQFGDRRVGSMLLDQTSAMTPQQRGQVLNEVASRESWTLELMDRLRQNTIPTVFLDASLRQQLLRHPNAEIRSLAESVLKVASDRDRGEIIKLYENEIRDLSGSVEKGKAIFANSCANCHRLEEAGFEIGPNLAAFANRGEEALLTNILDPNREVDSRYLAFRVLLGDGRLLTGAIVNETESSITIRDSKGESIALARGEIESLESTNLSLMPELLENDFTPQGMADLIAYLMKQRK